MVTTRSQTAVNSQLSSIRRAISAPTMDVHQLDVDPSAPFINDASDPIASLIFDFVKEEQKINFAFMGRDNHIYYNGENFAVYRANTEDVESACNRWNLNRENLGDLQWYTLKQVVSTLVNTIPLRCAVPDIDDSSMITNIGQLETLDLEDTKAWMDLSAWLRKELEWDGSYEAKFPEIGFQDQARWWRNNGRSFHLLDLPLELREMIYLVCVGNIMVPTAEVFRPTAGQTADGNKVLALGKGYSYGSRTKPGTVLDPDVDRPNQGILQVSRQVRKEALDTILRDATMSFRVPMTFTSFFRSKAPLGLENVHFLKHVQLEFSAAQYFQFLGFHIIPGQPFRSSTIPGQVAINTLRNIPSLKYLDFRFMSSKHPDAQDPWSQDQHSCQKIWIDWFFTHAVHYLNNRGFKVTISGCVKDSTRTKWEWRLGNQRQGYKEDTTLEARAIQLSKRSDDPIPCHCSIPCYKRDDYFDTFSMYDRRVIHGLQEEVDDQYWSFKD